MKISRNLICQLFLIASLVACKSSAQTGPMSETAMVGAISPVTEVSMPMEITQNSTGSKVTEAEAKEFLDHHNMARNEVGVSNLVWNATIASIAQQHADKLAADRCAFEHSGNSNYGENLFGGSGTVYTALDGSKSWYEEKADYVYAPINDSNYSHYTQMVWKTTTDVGVGVSICEDGSYIIVANYAPGGNMMGEYPY